MANLASAPLVNAKVYRHFAAVTFAVTLGVALLANGEARQTVDDGIAQQQQAAKLRDAEAKKFGVGKIGDRRQSAGTQGGFGEDYDPGYGAGSDPAGSLTGAYGPVSGGEGDGAVGRTMVEPQPQVLSPDEVAALPADEQRAYMNRMRNRKSAAKRAAEPADHAAIEAGSLARSGSSASD